MVYPTLTYLEYTVKYSIRIANKQDTSAVQTRIILTEVSNSGSDTKPTSIPDGIITDAPSTEVSDSDSDAEPTSVPDGIITDAPGIGGTRVEFTPQTLDSMPTMCLSSMPAIKENFRTNQWNHYLDQQLLLPHIHIIDYSHLYLQLYVTETPSPLVLCSLIINVSAAWVEDLQGKVLHDEIEAAEMRTVSTEKKIAEEMQVRLQAKSKSAEAILTRETAKKEGEAAKKKSRDDQLAKKHADDLLETCRAAKKGVSGK
ncbi:uncharacterized protein BJ212DRAFT_1294787 [Suillus subaureus]|uniref:Uncharacterized protein n=1 Tax=Suillus subaureus TaxID=48587 RepID=A0A9P7EPG0_9AGAM|nr:uncharacterized protein BJ212DRAFT_1294787 [Suillus subaureus]KAG1827550.1 hypothetical protein BJ212DRAFT_1294787 [Suillus subaureus]